jgi:gas vesicle protein
MSKAHSFKDDFTAALEGNVKKEIKRNVSKLAEKFGFDEDEAILFLGRGKLKVNYLGPNAKTMASITNGETNDTPESFNAGNVVISNPIEIKMNDCAETQQPNTLSQSLNGTVEKIQEENKRLKEEYKTLKNKISKLEHDIEMSRNKGKILFRDLIKEKTGYSVIKATQEQLDECRIIAENAIEIMKNEYNYIFPPDKKRINECGNFMENIVDKADPRIIKPTNLQGCKKATGYPDREKENEAYVEIKILAEGSENSTYRSFYVSTFDKVTKSIPHILMAFTHNKKGLTNDAPKIIDLYDLEVAIKVEYNASNNTIYRL